ncbi:hypothetical protein ACQ7NP_08735, partial [Pseudomonas anuradhapurensis]
QPSNQATKQPSNQATKQPSNHYSGWNVVISSIFFTISACTSLSHGTLNETSSETESTRLNEAYHRLTAEHPEFNWKFVEGLGK